LCGNSSTYTQTITVEGQSLEENGGEERSMEEIGGDGGGWRRGEENGGERPPSTVHRLPSTVHRLPFAVALIPNPAFDVVQVRYELEQAGEAVLIVSDLSGRVVHTRTYLADAGENVYALELETLAGGVYLVQVRSGGQRAVEKLIVLEK
jgi:hypothetical protein